MFRLALALGKYVHEIENEMSSIEFAEWAQYAVEEPFGEPRADVRAALTSFAVMKAAGSKTTKIEHFLPFLKLKQEAKTGAQAERAHITEAFLKASSRLNKRVIKRTSNGSRPG